MRTTPEQNRPCRAADDFVFIRQHQIEINGSYPTTRPTPVSGWEAEKLGGTREPPPLVMRVAGGLAVIALVIWIAIAFHSPGRVVITAPEPWRPLEIVAPMKTSDGIND